jgi:polysaccharide biosynthesis/export protein
MLTGGILAKDEIMLLDQEIFRIRWYRFFLVVTVFLSLVYPLEGQEENSAPSEQSSMPRPATDYKIGVGDLLTVKVMDAPELGGKFRVSESGMIEIPGVSTPIRAEDESPIELAHLIRRALIDAKQLRDPKISVFVEEFRGRTVTVLGSVSRPSVYPIQKRTTLLEALSLAGGALPGSGDTVTVVRGPATAEATRTEVGTVQFVQLSRLVRGEADNMEVRNGDVVNVSAAQVVYVLGAVVKPGGFTMANPTAGVSVLQALSLAEGFKPLAATNRGLIIRNSTSTGGRREIPVDIREMQLGKIADVQLVPDDILYVPISGSKRSLKVLGDVAMSVVTGVAIYGIGYRIGTQ